MLTYKAGTFTIKVKKTVASSDSNSDVLDIIESDKRRIEQLFKKIKEISTGRKNMDIALKVADKKYLYCNISKGEIELYLYNEAEDMFFDEITANEAHQIAKIAERFTLILTNAYHLEEKGIDYVSSWKIKEMFEKHKSEPQYRLKTKDELQRESRENKGGEER